MQDAHDETDGVFNVCTWETVLVEAREIVSRDEFMGNIISPMLLAHDSFSSCLTSMLAEQFATERISTITWKQLFLSAHNHQLYEPHMGSAEAMGLLDLASIPARDPASDGVVNPFLNFKGFKAVQSHRIAHILWHQGRHDAARAVQSRCSDLYAVDIHPAAVIDAGLMIDHGTGVVIGATAVVGRNCSFLHGVTLGSSGKGMGDRHPKVGHDVLIGCNSTILGNITIGDCCTIGSGSIVLKPLPCGSTAVGNPARIVGRSLCCSAAASMDTALKHVVTAKGTSYEESYSVWGDMDEAKSENGVIRAPLVGGVEGIEGIEQVMGK
ncbi:serine O-acetyltransferase [Ochromonadaceae sp. CCMP2298]|nr:serine O-acetyltransferase [Ochromonadaceae sp. CCMP2298]|mmetsp:Transcript_33029/g.72740  ORF Transcript_33029/g.72740 Transcript_33029/m.72740 type:complete len:325 (+) Transcript_33029:309-1283(+)|eukprot:CAMPEP_0173198342 /NCGR_PEP_ID=MMETSP1141-20130122/16636_1 /TAXON_ID=483371 /ORGANISM="non described non described, Strain CCMP2298" /LENGTH=324 /DNA_ID=CAMNT_0014123129 /DNA_START=205 /DNA_END=1179 /DNA_ORIENTATION=+